MISRPPWNKLAPRWVLAAAAVTLAVSTGLAAPAASAGPTAPRPSPSAVKHKDVQRPEWTSAAATSTAARLNADVAGWQRRGITVSGWSQDAAAPAKLDVWLEHYSKAAVRLLVARYGANKIIVERTSQPSTRALGRLNDTRPYFGADRINLSSGKSCTSGPKVWGNRRNTPYMLTAGHCGGVGAKVWTPQGRLMGRVTNRRYCDHCIDAETVSGNYSRYIWTGGVKTNATVYEDYGRPAAKNARVSTDGSFTGEVRGNVVKKSNMTVRVCDGHCIYTRYAFRLENPSGHRACHRGDSGSPIYTHEGGSNRVVVNGILVAGTEDGRTCYGVRIDAIENWFHVHIA